MKRCIVKLVVMVGLIGMLICPILGSAQGNLLPAGPPAPTMKTLDEIYKVAESRIPIPDSIPAIITEPGSYYLSKNIQVKTADEAIIIQADNVKIDLNGYSIIGPGASTPGGKNGISVGLGYSNISVMNGSIMGFGGDGITCSSTSSTLFMNIFVTNNGTIGIYAGPGAMIKNCHAEQNDSVGFLVGTSSVVENCISKNNGYHGFSAGGSCLFKSCVAYQNGGAGFYTSGGLTKFVECISSYNTSSGFRGVSSLFKGGRFGITINNSTASYNSGDGIYAGTRSTIENCSITNNSLSGIDLAESVILISGGGVTTRSIIKNCNIISNTVDGIKVFSNCDIIENNISLNTNHGITVENFSKFPSGTDYGTQNRIDGNHLTDNTLKGIYIQGKGENLIVRNVANNNGTIHPGDDYDIDTTNNKVGAKTNDPTTQFPFANIYF